MKAAAHLPRTIRFGIFELDTWAAELRKHGVRIHLQEQPFQVLMLLLERPGEVVTREELRHNLWSADTFVDFDRNLNKAMNKLRLALGDSAESPRFVETLHRRGYRFVAPVQVEPPVMPAADAAAAPLKGNPPLPFPGRRRPLSVPLWYAVGAVLIMAGIVLYLRYRPPVVHGSVAAPRRSIAVLAFKNLSGRPDQAWLSTALSDWLITELSAGEQLRTIPAENVARMSLELSLPDVDSLGRESLARIGKDLGTDLVVAGSYALLGKESGGQVRLDVRLDETRSGEAIASISETGTESALFDIISRAGEHLRNKLGVQGVTRREAAAVALALPSNHHAARLYSEGLARLRIFDALAARNLLQEAIALEPDFALSHSALATASVSLGFDDKAIVEARRAFELSSNLPRAERLLVEGRYREVSRNWEKAIEIYRALFAFYPDSLDYGLALANAQISGGRGRDAILTAEALQNLSPPLGNDSRIDLALARSAESLGDFKRDLAATTRAIEKARSIGASLLVAQALTDQAWALVNLGKGDDAPSLVDEARKIFLAAGDQKGVARTINLSGIVFQSQGDAVEAKSRYEEALATYREIGNKKGVADELDNLGDVLFALGDLKAARRSYEQSLVINHEIGNQDGIALAKGALASVLLALGDHSGAKRMSEESFRICQGIGDRSKAAIALAALGSALRLEGRLEEARQSESQAVSMFRAIGDLQSAARFQLVLAELLLDEGRAAEAAVIARQSADEFEREKALRDKALASALLSRAFLAQQDFIHANSALAVSNSLSGKYHDRAVEVFVELTSALVRGSSVPANEQAQIRKALLKLVGEATEDGFAEYALEGRLALAELELATNVAGSRGRLESLRNEAHEMGLGLLAQKAATVLRQRPR